MIRTLMFKPFVLNEDKLEELFQARSSKEKKNYVAIGHATFLKFDIQNKIKHTFRPVKFAKIMCHNVID